MELLAPAGSQEMLKAAIVGEADAVFLAGKSFGARQLAENFTDAELKAAVDAAHQHRVKVYVAVNTLIKEAELPSIFSFLHYLESIDVDAVIIQDRGLLRLVQENFSLPLHASTQMGLHTPDGVLWAEKNGVSRVILARELHLGELEKIRKATPLELEVFIHGALCYSFSGQCLFSSVLGGRSGNRGFCTQLCRKQYTLGNTNGYLLSTADIFGIAALPDLLRIGIDSVKIEGRMRSPLYVYLTSKIYSSAIRKAKEGIFPLITQREKELLEVVFNRGFGKGYFFGDEVVTHPTFAGSRGLFLDTVDFDGEVLRVKPDHLDFHDGITLFRLDEKVGGFEIKETERNDGVLLLHPPFTLPTGQYQIYKTKDREFDALKQKIHALNFPLNSPQQGSRPRKFVVDSQKRGTAKGDLSFYMSSLKSLEKVLPYADRVYFEYNPDFEEASTKCKQAGKECVLLLPRLSFGSFNTPAESLMIHSVGQFQKYSHRKLYGSSSMNFYNSLTLPELFQYTLSVELSKNDICELANHYLGRLEVMVFGRIELLVSREASLTAGTLRDQKRVKFPVFRDDFGFIHILNSADLFLLDYLEELEKMGINSFGIDLRRRDSELSELVAKAFYDRDITKKRLIHKKCRSITASHYLKGVL
ncbi:MAG: U32 family peptidase [Candidatus Bathyarchaeota archaeon]